MHLTSIRIRGFKSFPDPVEIRLEPGVAVVVGPNGSGKSNIADAIVWAGGSLSPSELRAEKPDDVMFGGAPGRHPAEFCAVELVFDNADRSAAVPFSELSIERRLSRGGEGRYLVNGAGVRRVDLVELLADLGLGPGMHSIIGQGRVEEVLAASPSRRRELVEEAAGLGRFKQQRHRAQLKLARVATQVERARDLEGEVRARLRPLALQATAAERAERLGRELAGVRARIAELDLAVFAERRTAAEERHAAAALARRLANERLEALLGQRGRAEEELADAAGRREAATAALYRLRSAGERVALRRDAASELAAATRAALAEAESALPADDLARARADALERDRRVAAARARLAAVEARRARVQEELEAARGARDSVRDILHRVTTASDRVAVRREAAATLLADADATLAEVGTAAGPDQPRPAEVERRANEAAAASRAAALQRDALADRLRLAGERLDAIERVLEEREGVAPAARALADEGARLAIAGLDVAPGAERAVAAALGWRASALVAADEPAALELIDRARREGLGSLVVAVGGLDPLADVAVVPVAELLSQSRRAVTPEGHGYDPDRRELWFAGETAEALLLDLERRRRALATDVQALERELRDARERAESARAAADRAEAELAAAAPLLLRRRVDPRTLARAAAAARRLDVALATTTGLARALVDRLTERAESAAAHAGAVGERAADLVREESAFRAAVGEAVREATAAAERLHALEPARPHLDAGRLAVVAAAAERLTETLSASRACAERLEPVLRARADAGAVRTRELADELRRLGAAEADVRRAAADAAEQAAAVEVELARIGAEAHDAERRLDEAGGDPVEGDDRDALAERAERLQRRREELGRVNPLAKEEYEHERARLEELTAQRSDLEASLAELEKLEADLADTVERRFAETFEAVARHFEDVAATLFPGGGGRLRLVEAQGEDEAGDEVGTGETSRFPQTPSTRPLTRTGRSAAGIEVELRPAGKRVARLSLLSGGEKALGAISFLFALFLARPCPFYLLDEVEAALDDTNIGRFVELLRGYANRAQFVVVTHQKRTIEAADILYGVTMGADGVSQVVSRRLPHDDRAALATA